MKNIFGWDKQQQDERNKRQAEIDKYQNDQKAGKDAIAAKKREEQEKQEREAKSKLESSDDKKKRYNEAQVLTNQAIKDTKDALKK